MNLTDNFKLSEFACGCGCKGHDQPEIIAALRLLCERRLQPLRDRLGVALKVYTGFRCVAFNKRCGGAKRSQHLLGKAADLIPADGNVERVGDEARAIMAELRSGGVKVYRRVRRVSFTHIDDRAGRWDGNR